MKDDHAQRLKERIDRASAGRARVKGGCRTCKIRKLKCDLKYPECLKCTSTGRTCDGYGVWGGGRTADSTSKPSASKTDFVSSTSDEKKAEELGLDRTREMVVHPPMRSLASREATPAERFHFEWFLRKTIIKLPGLYESEFWRSLLVQACHTEPAVFHAAIALTAIQRRPHATMAHNGAFDEYERMALTEYTKAIQHLQPRFVNRTMFDTRVALLVCLTFTYLEYLRGHYQAGHAHLSGGLRLLQDAGTNHGEMGSTSSSKSCVDQAISEQFSSLSLEASFMGIKVVPPFDDAEASDSAEKPFQSAVQARRELDTTMATVISGNDHMRQANTADKTQESVFEIQQRLRIALDLWQSKYTAYLNDPGRKDMKTVFTFLTLRTHHIQATIAVSCLHSTDEMAFDHLTPNFLTIINKSLEVYHFAQKAEHLQAMGMPGHALGQNRSMSDRGFIPPVYYTALKCRVRRIRMQAIRMLEDQSHNEGIWSGRLCGCIARRVMDIEEGRVDHDEAFDLYQSPDPDQIEPPDLPAKDRIRDLKVELPENPIGTLTLVYTRDGRTFKDTCDLRLRQWSSG